MTNPEVEKVANPEVKTVSPEEQFLATLMPDERLMLTLNPKGGLDQLNHRLRKRAEREARENGKEKESK